MALPRLRFWIGALALIVLIGCAVQGAAALEDYEFVAKWGNYGTTYVAESPEYVAVDAAGNVYVYDTEINRIRKFDAAGALLAEWGSESWADGQFVEPRGIAVDAAGNVYVADMTTEQVQKFDTNGTFLMKWGSGGTGDGQFRWPYGIAVDSAGTVYVADSGNNRIQTFTSNGVFTGTWGTPGTGEGELNGPGLIAIDSTGSVYVVDHDDESARVQKFTGNGTFVVGWGEYGDGDEQFMGLEGIAVDVASNVYVMDKSQCQIKKFDGNGTFLIKWGSGGSGDGQFYGTGIAVDAAGTVYVADTGNKRIQIFTTDGDFTGSSEDWPPLPGVRFSTRCSIAVDAAGNVYVADYTNNRVQKLDGDGNFITTWGSAGTGDGEFAGPSGITVDSGGIVWVTDEGNGRVQRFTSNGTFAGKWGSPGTADGQLNGPGPIAVDTLGNVFVSDSHPTYWGGSESRIQRFGPDGSFVGVLSYVLGCTGIAVDPAGNIRISHIGQDELEGLTRGVYTITPDGAWIGRLGEYGDGDNQIYGPAGVAVDSAGSTYVVDGGNFKVTKFAQDGTFLAKWGSQGSADGEFNYPWGIAVDSEGAVFVFDSGNSRVQKFASNSPPPTPKPTPKPGAITEYRFEKAWGSSGSDDGQFDGASGITVDSAGSVWVADSGNNRVQKFDANGTFLDKWGSSGSGDGQLSNPFDLAIDGGGNIYVSDTDNTRIQKFTSTGDLIKKWGSSGSGEGQLNQPKGIAVDSAGDVYVADSRNDRIQKFDTDGNFVATWGSWGSGDLQFRWPCGIAVDTAGNVHVADTWNSRVQMFDANGSFLASLGRSGYDPGQFNQPNSVAVDEAGNVYIADTLNHRVQTFDSDGALLSTWGSFGDDIGQFVSLYGIAVDGAGNVYVIDSLRIQKFAPVTPGTPVAAFSSNVTSGPAPLTVLFTDESTNAPTSRAWEFGDGGTSTEQNPVHVYTSTGTYTVNLTATNGDGSNTTSRAGYITVTTLSPPVAAFSVNVSSGPAPLAVLFTDESTNAPTAWAWEFGDGTTSAEQNPTHVYESAGTYTVNLTATNGDGSNTTSRAGYVTVTALSPPVAAFSANVSSGPAPLAVLFTDESTNAPTAWAWEFGDGGTSVEPNPVHVYGTAGTYTVNLTASNGDGSNTTSKAGFITVTTLSPPVAAFSANVSSGPAPLAVLFTNESTNAPTAWAWEFGDGGTSTDQNPVHVYTSAGTYTVNLTATNGDGSNTTSRAGYVTVSTPSLPRAAFSANITEGLAPLAVKFTDESTNVPTAWKWEFGDGTTSTEQNPTHVFASAGTYGVTLAVSNAGGTDSAKRPSFVVVDPASAYRFVTSWNPLPPDDGGAPLPRSLAVNATGNVYVLENVIDSFGSGPGQNRVQVYDADGTPLANWPVNDDGLGTYNRAADIAVDGAGNVYVADTDNHRVQKFAPDGTFLTMWGSEGSGTGQFQNPSGIAADTAGNVYVIDLSYRVQRFDADGAFIASWGVQGTGEGQLSGLNGIAVGPSGDVYVTEEGGYTHQRVQKFAPDGTFLATLGSMGSGDGEFLSPVGISVDGLGNVFVLEYGYPLFPETGYPLLDTLHARVQKFDADGTFVTKWGSEGYHEGQFYRATDLAAGASGTVYVVEPDHLRVQKFAPVTPATPEPPVAAFSANVTSGTAPLSVQFTDESTNAPTAWAWEFGDGGTSAEQNPTHIYTSAGSYTVNFTATNGDGTNTTSKAAYITVTTLSPPVAAFSANVSSGPAPLAVQFTDESTNGPTAWAWEFGDGATSSGQNPVHVYEAAGTFTVNLTATNADGSNSTSGTVQVSDVPVQANFTWTPEHPVAGEPVQFTDTSSGSPKGWEWTFGDGTAVSIEQNPVHTYASPGNYTVLLSAYYPGSEIGRDLSQTVTVSAPPIGGSTGYFLVSTAPAGAQVFLRDISGGLSLAGNTSAGPLNVTVYLTGTPLTAIVANLSGYADAVYPIASYPPVGQTVPVNLTLAPALLPVLTSTLPPTDTNGDGKYDDVNGNGRKDFADVVLYFNQMNWIAGNEPVEGFDYNGNGRIDFADVVWLFNNL